MEGYILSDYVLSQKYYTSVFSVSCVSLLIELSRITCFMPKRAVHSTYSRVLLTTGITANTVSNGGLSVLRSNRRDLRAQSQEANLDNLF